LGKEPGVLDHDGALVGDGLEEGLLVLAGLLIREVQEVDSAQGSAPRDKGHDISGVPRDIANEVVDRTVGGATQEKPPDVADKDRLVFAEGFYGGGRSPGSPGGVQVELGSFG
jgi:hypothetical protein